jgi:hypothetical protein
MKRRVAPLPMQQGCRSASLSGRRACCRCVSSSVNHWHLCMCETRARRKNELLIECTSSNSATQGRTTILLHLEVLIQFPAQQVPGSETENVKIDNSCAIGVRPPENGTWAQDQSSSPAQSTTKSQRNQVPEIDIPLPHFLSPHSWLHKSLGTTLIRDEPEIRRG